MQNKTKRGIFGSFIYILLSLIISPFAFALSNNQNFSQVLIDIGKGMHKILGNEYSVFGLTLVMLFLLFRAIYIAALGKIKIFEGSGGEGASDLGRTVGWTLSFLTCLSIAYLKLAGGYSAKTFAQSALGPFGVYGVLVGGICTYLGIYKMMNDQHHWAAIITGLFFIFVFGPMTENSIATLAGIVLLIFGIVKWAKGNSVSAGQAIHDQVKMQKADKAIENQLKTAKNEEDIAQKSIEKDKDELEQIIETKEKSILEKEQQIQQLTDILKNLKGI